MKIDNDKKGMKLNRFLAKPWVVPGLLLIFDILIVLISSYIVNSAMNISEYYEARDKTGFDLANLSKSQENQLANLRSFYFGFNNIFPHPFSQGELVKIIYMIIFVSLLVCNIIMIFKIRTSFSEKAISWNQYGEARFTTKKEIRKQYKEIDDNGKVFSGKPGIAVTSMKVYGKRKLYIDSSASNTVIVGGTRSGKGEIYVFRNTWIDAFAEDIKNRSSLIITDLKLELYKSMKKPLEEQGYIVRLLNLDDPSRSMGYNPLSIVISEYKRGNKSKAQMMARAFAFSIFHSDSVKDKDPLWSNTATDLFTALIIAQVSDAIYLDELEEEKRKKIYDAKRKAFDLFVKKLPNQEKIIRNEYINIKSKYDDIDVIYDKAKYIPPEEEYEVYKNKYEKNVNVYSCINFFRELCDRAKLTSTTNKEFEKKANNALDSYFNARPKLDFAAALYSEIKNSADKTKGSIYVNMQSALSIFNLDNIAKMTVENDIDFKEIGYGDRPIAIFIGVPFEDKSNHFLATTFITQVSIYLSQLAKETRGELDRIVRFRLDEFGNFPVIENFGSLITAGLSYGMYYEIYLQSLEQLIVKYGDDEANNILNNCMNKIYIMSGDERAAEYFSKLCGDKTIIEISRNGNLTSTDKNYNESAKGVPLIKKDDLMELKEGETLFVRKNTRKDLLGTAIKSAPILNEYADMPNIFIKIWLLRKVLLNRKKGNVKKHPNSEFDRYLTIREELQIMINDWRIENGTAFVYRYKDDALKDIFKNPKSIDFNDVCDEDLSHIDYTKRVLDPMYILDLIKKNKYDLEHKNDNGDYNDKKMLVTQLDSWNEIENALKKDGKANWSLNLKIPKKLSPEEFAKRIEKSDKIDDVTKKSVLALIRK